MHTPEYHAFLKLERANRQLLYRFQDRQALTLGDIMRICAALEGLNAARNEAVPEMLSPVHRSTGMERH